ncbi:hypothetical protein FHEFKHOI_00188 [Candidatus Methanoperedenaceae archaeon GB50]|nr:hypothetical protein FHEFKHOI_00188 [Candidatus Methanoperedenaceae archaeon GB50]
MPRKKARKTNRKSRREEDIFGLDIDMPKIEIPEIEIPSLDLGPPEQKKIDPNKIPKVKLIGILSRQLSTNQTRQALIRLGKHRLADEFWNEIEYINGKYNKMLMEIDGKKEETLGVVVDEIISHMRRSLYSMSFKPRDEIDFHKQIEPFLNGVVSVMETSLTKFGRKANVNREYKLPSNERIDLLVSVGGAKIGIEVKYDLKETSELQRLLGQIDRYIPYLDSLIVISYHPLSSNTINAIKNKEVEKGKPIRIVTPNKVV